MDAKKISQILSKILPYAGVYLFWWWLLTWLPFDETNLPLPVSILAAIGTIIFKIVIWEKMRDKKKYRKNEEYGSARWGTSGDSAPYKDKNPKNNIILTASESLMMNPRPRGGPKYARNKNILVIGGSGSGKTRFFVKPNLMQCESKKFPRSFVVTDPKGTLVNECGKMLKKRGYKIKVLNTIDFAKSMKYNPFHYIRNEKDILKFVTAFIANTSGEGAQKGEDFWVKAEILLYTALVGYIRYECNPDERNINTLVSMINSMEVREDDETFQNAVDLLFEALEERDEQHFAVLQYKKYKLAAGKTAKSILISCGARLAPFDIKEVRDLMSDDELDLDTLGDEKTALFVIISDTDASFNFIVALAYSQMFNLLCDKADNEYGGRLPVHVQCLLDEFANIGKIPNFEKLIATIRSREISVAVILQAQPQLKAIYKDNMDTIIGNCDTTLFLGGKEETTLKSISKMLGKQTIDLQNKSESFGQQKSHSQNDQRLGRDLMSMDEIGVMSGMKCILQIRGERPFFSDKYDIESHKNYKFLADFDKKHLFDVKSYLANNPVVRDTDTAEVYDFSEINLAG